jgi:hypothetical protein
MSRSASDGIHGALGAMAIAVELSNGRLLTSAISQFILLALYSIL